MFIYDYDYCLIKKRQLQDSNLRGHSPTDFESVSLTTRTNCHVTIVESYFMKITKWKWCLFLEVLIFKLASFCILLFYLKLRRDDKEGE